MVQLHSHDLGLLRLGKGIVRFDRFDANGFPTELRDLGNVPTMALTPTEEIIEHYTSREEVKRLDTILPVSQKIIGKFTLEEFDRENLRMALFGEVGGETPARAWAIRGMTSMMVEGYLDFWPTNEQGPKYHFQGWKVRLRPTGDIGLIDDTAQGKMDFEFTCLNDGDNHPDSPYFDYTLIGES